MRAIQSLPLAIKALVELGPQKMGLYALYQLELRSGALARQTPAGIQPGLAVPPMIAPLFTPCLGEIQQLLPANKHLKLLAEAGEITKGLVHLFGGPPVPLKLSIPAPLQHWTAYERGQAHWGEEPDVKQVWEPARFGWAYTLARAFALTGQERYAQAFWRFFEQFQQANPPNLGPHWMSAQEVALRLIAFIFCGQIFSGAPGSTPERMASLSAAIANHARRIPTTLIYARSQNNNHLVSEAAGLYSAGCALPGLPEASGWRRLGLKWLNHAFQTQIDADGAYIQQSANYHRLVLQLALWINALKNPDQVAPWTDLTRQHLADASRWLIKLVDGETGHAPNWGANDGAYIMPLAEGGFADYRPVAQACARAFLGQPAFQPGPWDEMGLWLGQSNEKKPLLTPPVSLPSTSLILVTSPSPYPQTRAFFQASHFSDRPSHAGQLAVDLWWHNLNVALDAGTFQYNAPPPWDNSLAGTAAHNTIQVDGKDQMTRAGRFLWLDWAQAIIKPTQVGPDGILSSVEAEHNGYRKAGAIHQRSVTLDSAGGCQVIDRVIPSGQGSSTRLHTIRLHWLLPDWEWELRKTTLSIKSPRGWINLAIHPENRTDSGSQSQPNLSIFLVRAGEMIYPPPDKPSFDIKTSLGEIATLGWFSPTYAQKVPALSFLIDTRGHLPVNLVSQWTFPQRYSRNP